ncbi:MAG: hypothetical protein [Bacteriophage sp.]|nr:MAG: hypothetical protein [Bacteriophage sp.]
MAVKTREEILESFKTRLGENPDDDSISFLEDFTDTLDDFEKRAKGDGTDWKSKYEENDANWRKKYTERFFSVEPEPEPEPKPEPKPEPDNTPRTFSDLFKEI